MNTDKEKSPVLVSACLGGQLCRYDGGHRKDQALLDHLKNKHIIYFCPEQSGGLSTPREKSGIANGAGKEVLEGTVQVLTESGIDVTAEFVLGARNTLKLVRRLGIQKAYLKSRSPSCGMGTISTFGRSVPGNGVTAELLLQEGIDIKVSE